MVLSKSDFLKTQLHINNKRVVRSAVVWPLMLLGTLLSVNSVANNPDFFELSLEELMSLPIKGVSNTLKPISEQPGTVSVISKPFTLNAKLYSWH